MSHLKLTRWFTIDKNQLAKFNSPSFTSSLEQQVKKWGILSVRKDKRYIKLQISRRIPLPQRQSHWTSTIDIIQTKLGGSSLLESETVIVD